MNLNLPVLNGNWVDLIIIFFLILALFEGWQRGFLIGLLDLSSFILSFLLALKFYALLAIVLEANFSLPIGIANALSFLIIGIVAETVIFWLLGSVYNHVSPKFSQSSINRILGFIPAIGETLIFFAFILVLTLALPVAGIIKADILKSKIGSYLVAQTSGLEGELRGVFGEAASEALNFFTIEPRSQEKVDLRFVQKDLSVDVDSERIMFGKVNEERVNFGLNPLIFDERVQVVARAHSKDMFERGYFSHYNPEGLSPFDRLSQAGITFKAAGENLALAPDVNLAHEGLMKSPGHRANILSPDFGRVGIGVIDGGIYGKMFTQNFTN
ncbi:CvpA family protein [Candidatus Microgenomates bacterium]|nr:CvpA family protein [Candidatus Microgenomates bacterium]